MAKKYGRDAQSGRVVMQPMKAPKTTTHDVTVTRSTTGTRTPRFFGGGGDDLPADKRYVAIRWTASGGKVVREAPRKGATVQQAEAHIAALSEGDLLPLVHPGEILAEEFLAEMHLSPIRLAQRINVPRTRIERLVACQTSMTPDTALRLERALGASAEFWLNLQTRYDLDVARQAAGDTFAAIVPVESTTVHG